MKSILRSLGLSCLGLLFWGAATQAATVNTTQCPVNTSFTCVTGIDDLMVGGVSYDMHVLNGTFNDLFMPDPSALLPFWEQPHTVANTFQTALRSAINAVSPSLNSGNARFIDLVGSSQHGRLFMPTSLASGTFGFNGPCPVFGSSLFASGCGNWSRNSLYAFAAFVPAGGSLSGASSTAPEPGTAAVLALGLLGLAVRRRRRTQF